jgi:hypothetical protein
MIYPRLELLRELLEDGIWVSIDDNEGTTEGRDG